MNNNIKRAKQYIDCFNKENPNITYTCFGPTGPTDLQDLLEPP